MSFDNSFTQRHGENTVKWDVTISMADGLVAKRVCQAVSSWHAIELIMSSNREICSDRSKYSAKKAR